MQKFKLVSQVIAATLLSFAVTTLDGQKAQAQRPVFLLKTKCVDSGPGNWNANLLDISIGKAVYTSQFYMGPGDRSASLTCKITPDDDRFIFKSLKLGFGMRDNDRRSQPNIVNVYLDGRKVVSRTVGPGQKASFSIDVNTISNVALETICSSQSQYCDRVYFFDASLERLPSALRQQ